MADSPDLTSSSIPAEQIVQQADPQLLKKLPPEQRERVLRVIQTAVNFKGPLPPPHMLAEYDRLIPQGAERLMRLLEAQTHHRHDQESRIVQMQSSLSSRGQWIGTVLCLFFGVIGWHLATNGHDWVAGVLFGTTILGLVTVFVLGRAPRRGSQPTSLERQKNKRK